MHVLVHCNEFATKQQKIETMVKNFLWKLTTSIGMKQGIGMKTQEDYPSGEKMAEKGQENYSTYAAWHS